MAPACTTASARSGLYGVHRHGLRCALALLLALPMVYTAASVHAQQGGTEPDTQPEPSKPADAEAAGEDRTPFVLAPLELDTFLTGSVGPGYPSVTLGTELGTFPLGDAVTVAVGGRGMVGYCFVRCLLAGKVNELDMDGWYARAEGQLMLHIDALARLLDVERIIDPYMGLSAGRAFYFLKLSLNEDPARTSHRLVTWLLGGILGLRASFRRSNPLFMFGELTARAQLGAGTLRHEDSMGTTHELKGWPYTTGRAEFSFAIGGGVRL